MKDLLLSIDSRLARVEEQLAKLREDMSGLKVKAGIWGALSALAISLGFVFFGR